MKIEQEKIVEISENELHKYYLSRGFDDIYSFDDFKRKMIEAGTIVILKE